MKELRLHGRGGQGVVLAAELLAVAASLDGNSGQAFPAFGGERRGAPVQAFIRLNTHPVRLRHRVITPDWVIILDASLLEIVDVLEGLRPGGIAFLNTERPPSTLPWPRSAKVFPVPATRIALEVFNQPVVNPAMLGAWAAATGELSLAAIQGAFRQRFPGELGNKNCRAAQTAYEWQRDNAVQPTQVEASRDIPVMAPAWVSSPGLGAPGRAVHFLGAVAPRTALAYMTGTWRYNRPVFDLDKCNGCGFCEMYCPDGCVLVEDKKYFADYRYCKGCGICAHECPRDAIQMVAE